MMAEQLSNPISDAALIRHVEMRRILFGPYRAPNVQVGDELLCSVYGLQVVAGWHGPKQWPRPKAKGRPRLIICGGLLDAIKAETAETVSSHWGVHINTVAKWRKRLGLEQTQTKGRIAYCSARTRILRREQPQIFVHPGVEFLKTLSGEQRRQLQRRNNEDNLWDEERLLVLQSMNNRAAADYLCRSLKAVKSARSRYKIASPRKGFICASCAKEWQSFLDHAPGYCPKCGSQKIRELRS